MTYRISGNSDNLHAQAPIASLYKNSSSDETANVNFYAARARKLPEFAEITQNNAITPFKVIQGHRFWYQSKAHIRFPISD